MTHDLTPELEAAIALGYQRRDRNDMAPTIAWFEDLLAQHPGNPALVFEVAGAYDTAGREAEARTRYEEALRLGLTGDRLRQCLCQYGSTLRWLGELDASLAILDRGLAEFPGSESVRIFRALTLTDLGRHDEAVADLLSIATDHAAVTDLGRYATGLGGLAEWYRAGRPDDE